MKKELYTVAHHHRHGTDFFLVRCDHLPFVHEVVKAAGLDYEEDRDDEWIEIGPAGGIIDI